jgi:small subunit ribosomal protein S5
MVKQQKRQHADDFGTEFEEKVLHINRCSKAAKGGRIFSFSALYLIGDKKGHVGFGFAKAKEVSDAIRKATEAAKKNVHTIELEDGRTIPHEVLIDWDGSKLLLKPAPPGTGIIAGSKVRAVLELAGVTDIVAKNLGSSTPINQVKAAFKAFGQLKNRETLLSERREEHRHV